MYSSRRNIELRDRCGVGGMTRFVGEFGRPCGTIGPVKWQCGSKADGIVGSTRGWSVTHISCGGFVVHAPLL